MKIGFIGLGKMGSAMTKRLTQGEHEVIAYDPNETARTSARESGINTTDSREELIEKLEAPIIWLMIPSSAVQDEVQQLLRLLPPQSIIIDGGNSYFKESKARSLECVEKNITFIDVGTSGGVQGFEHGYSMMVGGDKDSVEKISPVLTTLSRESSWDYCGESGSGHYVKMVHNAIEYGIMEAYAEGYELLKDGPYKNLDLAAAGKAWQNGSIIQSFLNQQALEVLSENPELEGIDGYVAESGEAKWALEVANENTIKMPAISSALKVRLESQQGTVSFATKLLAAIRNKFGGHLINKNKNE